jgi:RsiW-degrading membrane proteinase PrsW (M82 family)
VDFTLLPLAVTPILLLVHVIWMVDSPRREPIGNVVRYLLAGAFAGGAAIVAELMLAPIEARLADPSLTWPVRLLFVFVGVGLLEEACKLGVLAVASRGDRALDEPFDWVVYAVSVSLGFAALENVRVLWQGAHAGWSRAIFAVPVHALLGTLMGSHLARAMRDGPGVPTPVGPAARRRWLALIEPAAWHTVYDHSIFQMRAERGVTGLAVLLFLVVVAALWTLAVRRTASLWRSEQGLPPPILAPARTLARLVGVRRDEGRHEGDGGGEPPAS